MSLKVITLIENNPGVDSNLNNEHGLSLYIKYGEVKILFDTGKSGDFIKNAELLKVDLENLDYVFLSHGHYDHSGGYKLFVESTKPNYKLIVGKNFFREKYKFIEGQTYKYNGNPIDKEFIDDNDIDIEYVEEDVFYLTKNIMVFSNFKIINDFEVLNKNFKIKENDKYILDDFSDEIVLAINSEKGLIVIVGCSHIGIVNILDTIIKRTKTPIYGVIGGTHLIEADETRIKSTINYLKGKNIEFLALSHCTGEKAMLEISNDFGEKALYNNTGNVIKLS